MGTISLIVEGSTVGTIAQGKGITIRSTVSEEDSGRLIMAYAKTYASKFTKEDGSPRQPSIQEVLHAWWDGIVSGSIANVLSVEKEVAAETARETVQPINVG